MRNTSDPIKENSNVMNTQGGEKKVMKKILSVALSTAMAFSMFASVAFGDTAVSPQQQFDALKAKGIFTGYPDGTAGLDKDMTRAEFAKVITKLLGLKEITGTLSYTDKNYTAKNWAVPYIEAVTAAGIMEGKNVEKKIFDFNGKVTVSEMATILTRALDLEIPTETNNNAADWAKGYVQAAINAGLIDAKANFGANASRELLVGAAYAIDQAQSLKVASYEVSEAGKVVTFKISDGESVKVTLDKALEANKETEVKFTYKDKEFTEKVTYVVTSATKVESVKASNLKEIDVAFDGKVDKLTAEDKDRYSVDSSVVIESAALQSDEKTVRLTVVGNLQNQKSYKISVRNVKAGDRTVSVTNQEFTPLDNALPEVASVKSLGTKAVKVTFTEPVKSATSANFKLDGKTFFGSVTEGKRDVILKPYSSTDLTVGTHKLEVSGVEDFNGFKALTKEVEFEVVSDTTAPTIANVTATLEKATVTFSEEIDPDTLSKSNVYWKSGNDKKAADSFTQVSPEVYEFSFKSNPFPGYETPFFVEGVKDYSGNQITATETKLKAEVDQTRPEVTEVTLNSTDNKVINVKFSKEVKVEDVKYFTLTKSDGKTVALKSVIGVDGTSEDKAFKLSTYDALTEDSYTLKIVGVRDTTKLNNTMLDYTATVTGKDTVAPEYQGNSATSSTRTLYISFNKALNPVTVGDKSNYLVKINGTDQQLPSGTEVTPVNEGKGVRIVFPQYIDNDAVGINDTAFKANITHFTLLGLKDAANNVIDKIGESTPINTAAATTVVYESGVTEHARLTEEGTIKVRFDQPISTVKAGDFTVSQGTVTSASADGTNLVTLKISGLGKTGLTNQTSSTDLALTVATGNTIKTVTGNAVTGGAVVVKDKVKPQVQLASGQTRLAVENNRTILLPFSETLSTTNVEKFAEDLVVRNVRTGDLVSNSQFSTTVDGNVLKITLASSVNSTDDYTVSVRSDATSLQDRAGNLAVSSSAYTTVAGQLNTVATGVTATTAAGVTGAEGVTGVKEVNVLTVSGTAAAGDITVEFNDGGTPVSHNVTLQAGDSPSIAALKIANAFASTTGYSVQNVGSTVEFTAATAIADKPTVTITVTNTDPATPVGVTGNATEKTAGVAEVTAAKQTHTLTISATSPKAGVNTVTFTDGSVNVSATINVATTDNATTIGDKVVAAFNAKTTEYVASNAAGVVTFTAKAAAAQKAITVTFN
ncbi:S-layer homology domain-containing protein [Paenibacillus taichungensis]|uniref:S-layer homology domain-containing protein n=1 Tax=Paenibacillus taichungensis TaxID=484184 RepID=UPI0039A435BB